ncbi:tRNA (uracil-5-)-methyltransferase homolog A-like isoform X1 [Argiope bruennichi]|uniref:tRNA (uracil-5-)-methyltransferase homolog A-like isoform X1 n=1 Tax=Argiope bruennichi TaxID=94029 RepID=UPI002494D78C|nr:tRNA (uracil-5-)-methyltransferase homolog A-like isoform X1 [Argiope bruennichi]
MEVIVDVKQEPSDHLKKSLDVNYDKDLNMETDKKADSSSYDSTDNLTVEPDIKVETKQEPLDHCEESLDVNHEKDLKTEIDMETNSVVESNNKEENVKKELDLYSYTKLDDFTSEIFKIELGNLPNYIGYGQLRKLLNSNLKLHPRKVKAIGNPPHFAFITFRDEKDRDKALNQLNGYQWKGKTLSAKKANPAADPMAKKRKAGESEDCSDPKKAKTEEPIELKLKNAVTPYWNVPYEEQLKRKEDDIHKFLQKLSKSIEKVNSSLKPILSKYRKENYHRCCPLVPIKRSPVTTAYRNKCEFTVGRHLYTKEKTVGFRLNSYKEGSMSVAEPDDCINISESMLKAVKSFQTYVRESDKDVYNPENHAGYWRQLTVRTSNNGDVLLIVVMHPQSLSEVELEEEKMKLKKYYEEGPGSSCGVTSVYFQLFSKKAAHEETVTLTHLMGKKFLEETLLDMKFQVSPEAFFQINVPATEVLYSMVADLVNAYSSTTVLDICCGTGTISLCLAKKGAKVIGIEMCPEAIANARLNASNNGLPDVEFICGKAEDVITSAILKCNTSEIIAVVDPPRAGLHQKVLKVIRATTKIKKLIYISCNPNAAFTNFVDLCRTPSNNYKGSPFYPVQAMVVDMFPYTPHKELVMVFERIENLET